MNIPNASPLTREQLREKYPLTYPDLASWQRHVAGRTTAEQLNHDKHVLVTGGGAMPVHHEFTFTDDYKKAWQALFNQARVINCKWDKTRKRFV